MLVKIYAARSARPPCAPTCSIPGSSAPGCAPDLRRKGGSSSPRQSRPLHPLPESSFLSMLPRNPPAVGFLRQLPEPVLDIRDEAFGGDQIPDGMLVVGRLTALKNGVGQLAIEQDGSY